MTTEQQRADLLAVARQVNLGRRVMRLSGFAIIAAQTAEPKRSARSEWSWGGDVA